MPVLDFAEISPLLDRAVRRGGTCLFLSPHLDDAVLSCGALMAAVAEHCRVLVATVFTDSAPPPHTRAGRTYLRQCGWMSAEDLYVARRAEDIAVLDELGVRHVHLGEADALFRRRRYADAGPWRHVPELVHRYPTYRFDIARGRLVGGDRRLLSRVADRVQLVTEDLADGGPVFAPIGVGRHVDHLLTRAAGTRLRDRAIFYADFPYVCDHPVDERFVSRHGLRPASWGVGIREKGARIQGYATQVAALFPTLAVPEVAESYYRSA